MDTGLRVEQLAAEADLSVDTIRFYQSRGLLAPPRRSGRVAYYDRSHLARLDRIRALQAKGLTLATIGRLLTGDLDAADEALIEAVSATDLDVHTGGSDDTFDLDELAARSGIPEALLSAVIREGLLVPRRVDGIDRFGEEDVVAARAGLALLEAGLPLPEVLALARRHDAAMRDVAERAVALFDEHIRRPLRESTTDGAGEATGDTKAGFPDSGDAATAARLVDAFNALLPATTTLVTHHFRRTLLAVAQEHIERVGAPAERAAVAREATKVS